MANEQPVVCNGHEIEWDDSKVSRLWDYYSRTPPYSEMYFAKSAGHHVLRASGLPLRESLEVLDFGCGPGFIWEHLKKMGSNWKYTALDFSSNSIKTIIENASGHENFRGAIHVNSLPTNLPRDHFDVVLLFEVVEHLNDYYLDSTLIEIYQLLKKGGVAVVTTPNEENLSKLKMFCPECGAIFHKFQHVRSWSVSSLTDQIIRYGFRLQMAKSLDLFTQDLSIYNLLIKTKRILWQFLKKDQRKPYNMITVFQKV